MLGRKSCVCVGKMLCCGNSFVMSRRDSVMMGKKSCVGNSILFYSILGCVLPLQEEALRQSPPSFSVLCYPHPYRSLLPHNVISPTTFWSSD